MKYVLAILGIAAVIGVSVFCGVMWATLGSSPEEEIAKTDDSLEAIQTRLGSGVERVEQKHVQTVTEIRYIREAIQASVAAMDDDAVADGLNELASKWRVEKSTAGLRGNGNRISGDIAGRQGLAGGRSDMAGGAGLLAGRVQRPPDRVYNDD